MRMELICFELHGLMLMRTRYLAIRRKVGADFELSLAGEMLAFIEKDIATIVAGIDISDAFSKLEY